MEKLNAVILSFDNSFIWEFYDFVINNEKLNGEEKAIFDEIWTNAGKFELWNFSDLVLACKSSHRYIAENYNLSDRAIGEIVNALAYTWK